ncbi:BDN_1c_G0014150.mRNA.1.CDS.1 [Saccharomyces cerevisiae]|nr:BDN_1c_G0014150.mRNA.1.CDS.1 [Saccharomyces cerevisiae]CAI7098841.1 BDN_1c_G0014150.mRNA.1.CDS.1 [Saccharomyces cerevisiae]
MAWDINEKRKKKLRRPFHHIMYSSLNRVFFFAIFFFRSPKAYTNKSFFLFSIYFVIYHLYSNNILCFYSQCNSLGRMIFMCAYLPAACSRSVANPALPPQKKKKKKKKGNSQNGGG